MILQDNIIRGRTNMESWEGEDPYFIRQCNYSSITVNKIAEEWLEMVRNTRKYSTYRKYYNIHIFYIAPQFGMCEINSLKSEMINSYLARQALNGSVQGQRALSDSTMRSIQHVLNQIIKYANHIYGTDIIKFSFRHYKNQTKEIEVLNDKQCTDLINYLMIELDSYKMGIIVCLYTGLRIGEVCALSWEDIDLEQKVIHVRHTVQRIQISNQEKRTDLMVSSPKSGTSIRYIPIPEKLLKILKTRKVNRRGYLMSEYGPTDPRTYQNKFKKYLANAGVEQTNFHTLRHTFATKCIQTGFDVKCLSEILGHSDIRITMNRYVHPSMDMKRNQMDMLHF